MKTSYQVLAIAALMTCAAYAQANGVDEKFVDTANSVSFDGWNQLNRNRIGGALTEAHLVQGTVANVSGSGDAVLTRLSGDHYPAGYGLYGGGSELRLSDATLAPSLSGLLFQGLINDFDSDRPFNLSLKVNGSADAINAIDESIDNHYIYRFDFTGLSTPVSSYRIDMNLGFSQVLAFQVDQLGLTAAVPEPESYALMLAGLGLIGAVAARRRKQP